MEELGGNLILGTNLGGDQLKERGREAHWVSFFLMKECSDKGLCSMEGDAERCCSMIFS